MLKEKILAELKIARGQNASPTDRTLDQLADSISIGITEETQIPDAIKNFKPLIDTFRGETNHLIAEAVKDVKPVVPPVVPPVVVPPVVEGEPSWFSEWKTKQEKETADIKLQLDTKAKQEASAALVSKAKEGFLSKFKVSDAEKSLFEKAVAIELVTNPTHADAESMIAGFKSQYEGLRSVIGLPGLEAQAPAGKDGKTTTPIIEKMIADLQAQGKLPKEQS